MILQALLRLRGGRAVLAAVAIVFASTSVQSAPERAATPIAGARLRDCPDCPEMVVAPAGAFQMGSPPGESGRFDNEGPQHAVAIPRAFLIGRFAVTRGQYAAFVQATSRATAANCNTDRRARGSYSVDPSGTWRDPGFTQTDRDPVVCVSWDDAQAYAHWLSVKTGKAYRLPSEAEFEYAARGRSTAPYSWGGSPDDGCIYANAADRSLKRVFASATVLNCDDRYMTTAPVGSFAPNGFGLYDMTGNAWEWVEDCYAAYQSGPQSAAAREEAHCGFRDIRGGSWNSFPRYLRSAYRHRNFPSFRSNNLGFRVARSL